MNISNRNRSKPIGLLYDSVSNNTGDIAIGLALQQYLDLRNISYEIVDPFLYNSNDYAFLIIGGGQIIRPESDPFYDSFRVPGKHILNGVGIDGFENLEYLKDYAAVSVRSESVINELNKLYPNIDTKLVPCVSVILDSKDEITEIQENDTVVGCSTFLAGFVNCLL